MKHLCYLLVMVVIFSPALLPLQMEGRADTRKSSPELEIEKVRKKMLDAINNHDFETMEQLKKRDGALLYDFIEKKRDSLLKY